MLFRSWPIIICLYTCGHGESISLCHLGSNTWYFNSLEELALWWEGTMPNRIFRVKLRKERLWGRTVVGRCQWVEWAGLEIRHPVDHVDWRKRVQLTDWIVYGSQDSRINVTSKPFVPDHHQTNFPAVHPWSSLLSFVAVLSLTSAGQFLRRYYIPRNPFFSYVQGIHSVAAAVNICRVQVDWLTNSLTRL